MVQSVGIEPTLQAPQACVLSIERRLLIFGLNYYNKEVIISQLELKETAKIVRISLICAY